MGKEIAQQILETFTSVSRAAKRFLELRIIYSIFLSRRGSGCNLALARLVIMKMESIIVELMKFEACETEGVQTLNDWKTK